MSDVLPMTSREQSTVSLGVTSTTDRVALGGSSTTTQGTLQTVQVKVCSLPTTTGVLGGTAASVAYIAFGDVTVEATVPNGATPGSMPILPGAIEVFTIPVGTITHVAAISSGAGVATLTFTQGYGP